MEDDFISDSGNDSAFQLRRRFQICVNCNEAEQKREETERHPINQSENHALHPMEITDAPVDAKDDDEIKRNKSKAKAEKNQAMSKNSCHLCAVEKLTFKPPPIYCTLCGACIKRNSMYYCVGAGNTRHYFCIPCYIEAHGDTIVVDGTTIPKARLEKKKNDEETEEWWVQCDNCEAWQHQICALFNG